MRRCVIIVTLFEERGMQKGKSELIKNMFDRGRTLESIAEDVNMSVEEVGRLLNLEKAE